MLYDPFLYYTLQVRASEGNAYVRATRDLLQNATLFRRTGIHPHGRVSYGKRRGELFVQKFYRIQTL